MGKEKYILTELFLGNRQLGYELWTGKEVIEYTEKQIKNALKVGEEIHGLQLAENGTDLEFDEAFFTTNMMEKRHINNFRAKVTSECMANIMYVVTGRHKEAENVYYDVISSRFERTTFSEAKLKAMLEIGCISGGAKLESDMIIMPVKSEDAVKVKDMVEEKPVVFKKGKKEERTKSVVERNEDPMKDKIVSVEMIQVKTENKKVEKGNNTHN